MSDDPYDPIVSEIPAMPPEQRLFDREEELRRVASLVAAELRETAILKAEEVIATAEAARKAAEKGSWFTLERMVLILGILVMVFTAGMNWHRIDVHEVEIVGLREAQAAHQTKDDRDFARKDVLDKQFEAITRQLDQIQGTVVSIHTAAPAK